MLKQHETKTDRERELRAIIYACEKFGGDYHKLPAQYQKADFVISKDGIVVALVEVKGRSAEFGKHKHCFIAAHKRQSMIALANAMDVPAYILYSHPNGYYLLDVSEKPLFTRMMQDGRDRDNRDYEPVICWSIDKCKRL